MTALPDIQAIARVMGGQVAGRKALVPGPGHSPRDRSLSVSLSPTARDGFFVHSFAGDPWQECRDYVCERLGIPRWRPAAERSSRTFRPAPVVRSVNGVAAEKQYTEFALRLWNEARDPRETVVTTYLRSRKLSLEPEHAGSVIRFHPELKLNGAPVAGMLCLFRDIRTNNPCGIHRTFLDSSGLKLERKMLGRASGAAIKFDADETITLGLHIGEGVETCIAAGLAGFRPVWAIGSANAIASFPVLSGVEAITIMGEVGDGGANERAIEACAARWTEAGNEAFVIKPLVGADLNDVWREVA